ncbi:hypothetical protein FOCG_10749 [Fusarium oxysporum f. sp. radicis-lycopersici 26381]|uniref:Uncharacterized protein n=4 Tax=Fusarium oxysporum TaxID=5507 RepID=A0A420PHC8_FUSOX|nr:uncharacterized protein FOBCDRAFT_47249 [Fusarium oxysporum Fo47]EXK37228.1 hypothetical protein FOMG_08057 [Fusarium oxysporum f. sp. melonis 26406]EXL48301.1 hypothetical protein FOCG_10749 [Fusarium oxysporum f. sp. radicis-lycopersici 26381]KAF5268512.1 hypothetical protein FOXYS1_604 [Fusarium oxysporum]RKK14188.1 hypothetical protein BFJ65_g10756 [Fusarium oxysporum f. sp. cepae]EWZ34584.1 hypothetical protein FOZG_12520 [Fusarium oxysporum Fo47]
MTPEPSLRRQRKVVITTSPAPSDSDSRRDSYFSEVSQSTAPTSFHSASGSNNKCLDVAQGNRPTTAMKSTTIERRFDTTSSSIATYDSVLSEMAPLCRDLPVGGEEVEFETEDEEEEEEEEEEESGDEDDDDDDREDDQEDADKDYILSDPESLHIPPVLPPYRGTSNERPCRPSTPQDFGRLFPSLDRLAVRHDDCTSDGNMNLRVDTVVPFGHTRRTLAVQLFHLRMHDLARREFSLRRYCRDSGREVCNSKRAYAPAPTSTVAAARPALQRSMSSAMRTMATPFHRPTSSNSSIFKFGNGTNASTTSDNASVWSGSHHTEKSDSPTPKPKARMVPTNRIKLEFSNYARVDIARRGGRTNKRYEFEWWGHTYAWKRVIDKNLNVVSFHLVRDGHGAPVAHIVPEMRSPNQILDDEMAGAWVTPCYIWISDSSIIDAITDVADVIIATGLISLVDDCIKERWQAKKPSHRAIRRDTGDVNHANPRSFMHSFFQRRHSEEHSSSHGALRFGRKPVAAY